MKSRLISIFFYSAAGILVVTAAAKAYTALGNARILSTSDPVLHLPYRYLLYSLTGVEALTAAYLISSRCAVWTRALALLWLSSNFILYRFTAEYLKVRICPCLGTLASELALRQDQVDRALAVCVLYWFLGSAWLLLEWWNFQPARSATEQGDVFMKL